MNQLCVVINLNFAILHSEHLKMEKQPSLEEKKEKKSFFKTMMKKAWVDAKHYNANPANSRLDFEQLMINWLVI